jgi:ferredoxin
LVKHGALSALAKSNYYASLDKDSCIACGVCVDRCQVRAIRVEDDETVIDRGKCVGCGLCAYTCPTESITMAIRQPEERIAPFPSQKEMLQAITKDRKKPLQ